MSIISTLLRRSSTDFHRSLPPLPIKQKPKHIIEYAKTTRQGLLKYLAVLRWKQLVDIPSSPSSSSHISNSAVPLPSIPNGPAQVPTPRSNGESPQAQQNISNGKGKGKAKAVEERRGKVTDAKRVTHFMEHQNGQHEVVIGHLRHVARGVESLRFAFPLSRMTIPPPRISRSRGGEGLGGLEDGTNTLVAGNGTQIFSPR